MQKFFVKDNQIKNGIIKIDGTDVNHIINVLRLKENDEIQICNKDTSENYVVKIEEYNNENILSRIIEKIETTTETTFDLEIFQGLPKADKMEFIIQKTTEIGVKKIIPVAMERCVVKLSEKDVKKKTERWQKIAEVAAKQSKRDCIPEIEDVIGINSLYNRINQYDLFIVAYEEEKQNSLKEILLNNKNAKKIGVLIVPEGGIDSKEIENLKENGAKIITLGSRILRTETAPIVIAGNIVYELEN